jgi:asparagine N-glycosylation enzyme membrane subunit Stt3
MTDIIIGLTTTFLVILFLEVFKSVNRKLIGAFTLSGIAFIYVGFAWTDLPSLAIVVAGVAVFLFLAYYAFTKDYRFITLGLLLHGIWDMIYPNFTSVVPQGYDLFCLTIDFLLAIYFYFRLRPQTNE